MLRAIGTAILTIGLLSLLPGSAAAEPGVDESVVRIINASQGSNWWSPWTSGAPTRTSGSGFVLRGGLVLTNAHVVSNSRLLVLLLHNDPNPHEAEIVVMGHDCDLALVRPVERGLLDRLPALELGALPALRSTVETYGFPAGGEQLSSTRGVVSRIEHTIYTHSGMDSHLAVQTDAAINPGNSGGPVVQGGKVVGVAFQNASKLQNVGYFIPTEVVRHFLTDAEDGRYDGYPELGTSLAKLENPAARRKAGLGPAETGVLVDRLTPDESAEGYLQVGDVALEIDGKPIANDGSVAVDGLRLPCGLLVDRHQIGESVQMKILRAGERKAVSIPLRGSLLSKRYSNQYDAPPNYFIYGGLVFVPLDREMLGTFGSGWVSDADAELLWEMYVHPWADPSAFKRKRVVLLRRLDHPVNAGVTWHANMLVEAVNGERIDSLEGLIRAVEGNRDPFLVLEFDWFGRFAVIDRAAADAANASILEAYGIPKDRHP